LTGSALTVLLLIVLSGCDTLSPPLSKGTITGTRTVVLDHLESEKLWFYEGITYYGYVELTNFSYGVEISAPYGIYMTTIDLDTAPPDTGGVYRTGSVELDYGRYYFVRPDSLHYGKLLLLDLTYNGDSATVTVEWYVQTESKRRDFR